MKLTPVATQHIGDCWGWVRQGLEAIREKGTPEACPWLPEDVYHALMTRAAVLYVIGERHGFCVLQKLESSYEQVMFVWAMWARAGTLVKHKREVCASLDALAHEIGCKRIRMFSSRDSEWQATKLFTPVSVIFEREV